MRLLHASALVVSLLSHAALSAAQPPSSGADTAFQVTVGKALLEEGRKLVGEGWLETAREKLTASVRSDPSPEALLALGDCEERLGKTASAWGTFHRAEERAKTLGETARAKQAGKRAEALEGRLSKVKVIVSVAGGAPEVTLDDRTLPEDTWGVPLPLDPGPTTVRAASPGKQAFSTTFELLEGASREVVVPALVPLPTPTPSRIAPEGVRPFLMARNPSGSSTFHHRTPTDWHAVRAGAWSLLAIGAATALAGGVVAYSAGYVKGDTTVLVSTGLGMVFGGGAIGGAGYVMLVQADKHVSSAPLPFRVAPLVARSAAGLSLTGTF